MSHLGERLSGLVDGELNGAELDRVNAHLAGCEPCRAEASELRTLKHQLQALGAAPEESAMLGRLVAMIGPGGPLPPRRRAVTHRRWRRASRRPGSPGPGLPFVSRSPAGRPRRRYTVAGALGIAVLGLGAAAFTVGGGGAGVPAPRITPPMEVYSVEHAIITGDVPLPEPSGTGTVSTQGP